MFFSSFCLSLKNILWIPNFLPKNYFSENFFFQSVRVQFFGLLPEFRKARRFYQFQNIGYNFKCLKKKIVMKYWLLIKFLESSSGSITLHRFQTHAIERSFGYWLRLFWRKKINRKLKKHYKDISGIYMGSLQNSYLECPKISLEKHLWKFGLTLNIY